VASQSSTNHGGVASRAIDDNTDGIWQNDSVTHTSGNTSETWWRLNLRAISSISEVIIYNRSDCCSYRILGFQLIIWFEGEVVYSSETEDPDQSSIDKSIYQFDISEVDQADEVEIVLPGTNRVLSLAEVQVFGIEQIQMVNVAVHGVASQSSTVYGAVASYAIDDDTNGSWPTITRTDTQTNPWWRLILREVTSISNVIIFNRSDCCSERILGFELIVRYEGISVYSSETDDPDQSSTNKPIYRFDLSGVDLADEVEIRIIGTNRILSLAEVQVFGREQMNFTAPSTLPSSNPSAFPTGILSTTPSAPPSPFPSFIPSMPFTFECDDSPLSFRFRKPNGSGRTTWRTCSEWVAKNVSDRCLAINGKSCPKTCGTCDRCVDSKLRFKILVDGVTKKTTCDDWVAIKPDERCQYDGVPETCRLTCSEHVNYQLC